MTSSNFFFFTLRVQEKRVSNSTGLTLYIYRPWSYVTVISLKYQYCNQLNLLLHSFAFFKVVKLPFLLSNRCPWKWTEWSCVLTSFSCLSGFYSPCLAFLFQFLITCSPSVAFSPLPPCIFYPLAFISLIWNCILTQNLITKPRSKVNSTHRHTRF